jgi:hypothetical protein
MSIYSTLRTSVRNVVISALPEIAPVNIIFSHTNGIEPTGSYVTISIIDISQQGKHTSSGLAKSNGASTPVYNLTTTVAYEGRVQFSFVGSDSGDLAHSFNQRINNNPLVLQELSRNKLGVMRKSQVRRAPQKRDTKWVEYHNIDVTFSYHVVSTDTVDIVEGITVEGVYNDTLQDNFTIPENLVITP